MPRVAAGYVCTACGRASLRWEGKCPGCGEWNALEEAPRPPRQSGQATRGDVARPRPLSDAEAAPTERTPIDLGELDLLLGGGLVRGSLILLGGPPGVGKSTLLLQLAARLAERGGSALYVSGEESGDQVRLRAERVGRAASRVLFLAETDVEAIVGAAEDVSPDLLCVDSVQTLRTPELSSAPGTVNQVRESAARLQGFAKRSGTPTVLVGHVTKGGALAGPRSLEHLVDVVVYFEGPRGGEGRILRATKNRFGRAGEIAVFRMAERGLEPVPDPARAFLAGRRPDVSGSAVAIVLEGTRPLPVEVQALTTPARFAAPQRLSTGIGSRRLDMLLAVLERRGGVSTGRQDVFVNVIGGLRVADPGADLAVLAALISAELDRPVPEGLGFVGEVGLGGEVRGVAQLERRLREADRAGLTAVVVPAVAAAAVGPTPGVALRPVARSAELVTLLRG